MKQIMISGYYGFDNAGDEAILSALCQLFEDYPVQITVLTAGAHHSLPGCRFRSIQRTHLPAIIQALKQCDLFISGGGGLFQDVTGLGSVPYYGGLLKIAQTMGVPTMVFGQGIGPLRYGLNRWLLKQAFRKVKAISVRDEESYEFLEGLGLSPLHLTADPVLTLKAVHPSHALELLHREGVNPTLPMIGVSIRPWPTWFEKQLKAFTAVLAQFARACQAQLVLIPFQPNHDTWMCEEVAYSVSARPHAPPLTILRGKYSPIEVQGMIGRLDMMVGMRLHALIMSAAEHVPAVGLVYDPKVRRFAEQAGYKYVSSITALSEVDYLETYLRETWQQQDAIRAQLHAKMPPLQAKVYEAREHALQLMNLSTVQHDVA